MAKNNQLLRIIPTLKGKLAFTALFASFLSVSYAQDFEVAPVKLNYDCEAGEIQTKMMTVRNHANTKQQFSVDVSDMVFDDTIKSMKNRSCKDWLTVNPSFFDLNPNESFDVKVILQVPPGEFSTRGALIHVSATEEQTAFSADKQMKSAVKLRPRIGVKVVQSPRSNNNYKGAISGLKEVTLPKDTVRTFHVVISNPGDKMLNGKVYLVLSNLETAKEIKDKPRKVSLFPGTSKTMTLYFPKEAPVGKYSMAAILDYGNNSALEAVQMNVEVR